MVETKRKRGRPFGSKNRKKPAPERVRPPDEVQAIEELLAGNGRDEVEYEPSPEEVPAGTWAPLSAPVLPTPPPQLQKLFISAVENGYLVRPAYSHGEQLAHHSDERSWVVTSRDDLASLVTWLIAERGPPMSRDMLGGARAMPQPEAYYVPPQVFEEAGG